MSICSYRGVDKIQLSILVLDYLKPEETKRCLVSIKDNVLIPHKTYLLSNGVDEYHYYPYEYYRLGLVDYLMLSKKNVGCGRGIQDLFRICDTEFAILMQNDQIWGKHPLDDKLFEELTDLLKDNVKFVGLAGNINQNKYTERANLMRVEDYLSIPDLPIGGPGLYERTHTWTEQYIGEWFDKNNWKLLFTDPLLVLDIGKYTVRELPCGGVIKHRTDTGQLEVFITPLKEHPGYDFDSDEWADMIAGTWEKGRVPRKWQKTAFNCWDSVPHAQGL